MPTRRQVKTTSPVSYNPFQDVYDITSGAFRQLGKRIAETPEVRAISDFAWRNADRVQPFYQVRRDDKSIMDVAAKNNIAPEQLVAINNTKTLPPVGSYLQLQPVAESTQASTQPLSSTWMRDGRGDPAAQSLRNQASAIQQQLMSGQLPDAIPSAVIGFIRDNSGTPLTISDLIAEGYVMDSKGVMVKGGGVGAGMVETAIGTGSSEFMSTEFMQYNIEKNVPFLKQLRWDPERKRYVQIGTLIREGKLDVRTGKRGKKRKKGGRRRGGAKKYRLTPESKTGQPGEEVLMNIHLGSG